MEAALQAIIDEAVWWRKKGGELAAARALGISTGAVATARALGHHALAYEMQKRYDDTTDLDGKQGSD